MSAQTTVLASMSVAVGSNAASFLTRKEGTEDEKGNTTAKVVVGGMALTVGLLIASEFQPRIASSVAVLVMVASLLGPNGVELFNTILRAMNAKPTAGTGTAKAGSGNVR